MNIEPPSILPVRLKRETEFKSQLGCTAMISALLLAVAAFAWFAGKQPGDNSWVAYVVGGAFGFFGLLCLWSLIRQLFASGIPVTVVEVSEEPLQPGENLKVGVIQCGPAKLKLLRANLVCLQRTTTHLRNASAGRPSTRMDEVQLHSENLIEARHLHIAAGDAWQEVREFTLPAEAQVSGTKGNVEILWKIEVWGTGYGLASFMHPFVVDVFRGQRPVEEAGIEDEKE